MNKRYFSIAATVAIILSVANMLLLIRGNAGASRLSATNVPQRISYQGRLTDRTSGKPVPDGPYNMRFCLYAESTGGSPIWCEDQTVSVEGGVFSVLLGNIPETAFDGTERYLGVKISPDTQEMDPRRHVVSVGYAYKAEDAAQAANTDTVDGIHASVTPEANKLVPLGSNAKLPSSVLPLSAAQAAYNNEVCVYAEDGAQDMPGMTLSMATYGSELLCMFTAPIILDSGGGSGLVRVYLYIDGNLACSTASEVEGKLNVVAINWLQTGLIPGNHTVKIVWNVGDGGRAVCQRYGCRTLTCLDLN